MLVTAAAVALTPDSIQASYDSSDPADHLDLDRAVSDLHELRQVTAALKMWDGLLTDWISDALGRNETDVEGVGHVQVKHGAKRTEWDRRQLIRAVLDSRLVDPSTGEVSEELMAEVAGEELSCSPDLARVLHVWNLGAPRVTALRVRGIDPDEFAHVEPGKASVIIT